MFCSESEGTRLKSRTLRVRRVEPVNSAVAAIMLSGNLIAYLRPILPARLAISASRVITEQIERNFSILFSSVSVSFGNIKSSHTLTAETYNGTPLDRRPSMSTCTDGSPLR